MREEEIIQMLKERRERGAEELLSHYGPLLRYVIAPILPGQQDREDCLSEVLLRVWEKIELYDEARGSWKAWLTALARNTALNRARQLQGQSAEEPLVPEISSTEPTPEEALLRRERRQALEKALRKLSSREQQLFYRKYYYRQSTAQIAREMGLTERAVEGRLYRLRQRLKSELGGESHE